MRACSVCRKKLNGRADQRFCSEVCRKRASREAAATADKPQAVVRQAGPSLVETTRAKLREAGAEDDPLGASALLLAADLDAGDMTGSAKAALNREWRATLAEATRGQVKSGLSSMRDELAERRARA